MLVLANLLLVVFGLALLLTAVQGKPTRGENMMGFHLVVFPLALGVTAATGLGVAGLEVALPWPTWWHYATLPGLALASTVLVFGCYDGRKARVPKIACFVLVAGMALLTNGFRIAPVLTNVGSGVVLVFGFLGTLVPIGLWLRARARRILSRLVWRRWKKVDAFEEGQIKFQRTAWQQLPVDAEVADVIGFTRSLAPDVKADSLERLRTRPDLESALLAQLSTPRALEAMHYLRFDYPLPRAPLGAEFARLLDRQRDAFEKKARHATPPLWTGDIMPLLECGIAVLRDGGDVRAALERWHATLVAIPDTQELAKELARLIEKSR